MQIYYHHAGLKQGVSSMSSVSSEKCIHQRRLGWGVQSSPTLSCNLKLSQRQLLCDCLLDANWLTVGCRFCSLWWKLIIIHTLIPLSARNQRCLHFTVTLLHSYFDRAGLSATFPFRPTVGMKVSGL